MVKRNHFPMRCTFRACSPFSFSPPLHLSNAGGPIEGALHREGALSILKTDSLLDAEREIVAAAVDDFVDFA